MNMSPEDTKSSQLTADAEAQAKENEIAKWTAERDAFLRHPEGLQLYQRLNRRIAAVVSPGCTNWEDVSATNMFQEAFDLIIDRLLAVDGFRNVMEKYATYRDECSEDRPTVAAEENGAAVTKPLLSKWEFTINRVTLVLSEWRSSRSNRPIRKETPDEHIESNVTSKQSRDVFSLQGLSQRIDSLKLQHRATLMLWIWPVQTMPEAWRETYLPMIQDAGAANGVTRNEVKLRFDQVMTKRQTVSEDGLLEAETRRGLHFESERHFNLQKRLRFGDLQRLEDTGEFMPESGVEAVLTIDCYEAVKKSSEVLALAMFASKDVFSRAATGIRKVSSPNWFRRSFCKSCYKQRYHRRIWLNAAVELLNLKPENGPMSHADIGWILNCPENTSYSNLNRARKTLLEGGIDDDLSNALQRAATGDSKAKEEAFKRELDETRLRAFVCEDLKPPAG